MRYPWVTLWMTHRLNGSMQAVPSTEWNNKMQLHRDCQDKKLFFFTFAAKYLAIGNFNRFKNYFETRHLFSTALLKLVDPWFAKYRMYIISAYQHSNGISRMVADLANWYTSPYQDNDYVKVVQWIIMQSLLFVWCL